LKSFQDRQIHEFFDWNTSYEENLIAGFHSFISEVFIGANELQIEIDYDKEINWMIICAENKDSTKNCKKREISRKIIHIFENRHYETLGTQNSDDNPFVCSKIQLSQTFICEIIKYLLRMH
jgi:hypothetical protein